MLTYGGGPFCRDEFTKFGARAYFSMYNGLDPETHFPVTADAALECDVAFLGNRLPDREARVEELFLRAAELAPEYQFLLGGEGWGDKPMPANVRYIGHVPTGEHNRVNCSAGMVMNINRASMAASFGFSPPTRVFEVAGAGTCLLCDDWPGIDDCFEPGSEILVVKTAEDVVEALRQPMMSTLANGRSARLSVSAGFAGPYVCAAGFAGWRLRLSIAMETRAKAMRKGREDSAKDAEGRRAGAMRIVIYGLSVTSVVGEWSCYDVPVAAAGVEAAGSCDYVY